MRGPDKLLHGFYTEAIDPCKINAFVQIICPFSAFFNLAKYSGKVCLQMIYYVTSVTSWHYILHKKQNFRKD